MNASHSARAFFRVSIVWCLILSAGTLSAAVVYDFVQRAPEARWSRSPAWIGELPFNGAANDARGIVRHINGQRLEDGTISGLILQTHPEWKNGGMIFGTYSNVAVPANARFTAKVGFLADATASDGAFFEVYAVDPATNASTRLCRRDVRYDGALDEMSADLSAYGGRTMTFQLVTNAGGHSAQDWTVWVSAAITQEVTGLRMVGRVFNAATVNPPAQQAQAEPQAAPQTEARSAIGVLRRGQTGELATMKPAFVKAVLLLPSGAPPDKHAIIDAGSLPIEEPLTVLNHIYQDNQKPSIYYYLPKDICLIRDAATASYRISAVWTQDQKVRTSLVVQANIDPADVRVLETALKKAKGPQASLLAMPYDQASIIDMKGWEDWQIENIRIPTFGSLESELPISISMTPETLAQLKPLLEKEGLTAGMRIKTGDMERAIPIKVGLKYTTGRMYSPVESLQFSYNNADSTLTLHDVENLLDFPFQAQAVNLRFVFPGGEEVYKGLPVQPAVTIAPRGKADLKVRLVPKALLAADVAAVMPPPPPGQKPNPLLAIALGVLKSELDKKSGAAGQAPAEPPIDPKLDAYVKNRLQSYWLDIVPDYDCQACLDKIWSGIEGVSYVERSRKITVEALANLFDPASYDNGLAVGKVHIEIRSPYLSAQSTEGLVSAVDLTPEKLKDTVPVYLPSSTGQTFSFEFKLKVILKTGESASSPEWEKVDDSMDLTLGTFHIKKLFEKKG